MAKPLLVINYCIEGIDMRMAVRNLRDLQNSVERSNVNEEFYVFLLPVTTDSFIKVFYDKDFDEIKYEELKKMIEEKMASFDEEVVSAEGLNEAEDFNFGPEPKEGFFRRFFKPWY